MFKRIPGSNIYSINLLGEIKDFYGNDYYPKRVASDIIEFELFGTIRKIRKRDLILIAWYELGDIKGIEEELSKGNIQFCKVNAKSLRVDCGHLITFKEPINYIDDFFYIPNYSRYAINNKGIVIDTTRNEILKENIRDSYYSKVSIYSPDKNKNKSIPIHRLLALTFIPNNDFINRPFINHIDGDKTNNSLINLEWCSNKENCVHAARLGLLGTNCKMKSRDFYTGEVVVYMSMCEMANKLNMPTISVSNVINRLPGYLYQKRYEIKLFEDDTPWYYDNPENTDITPTKSIYSIKVRNKRTGEIQKFNNVGSFNRAFKIWPNATSLDAGINKLYKKTNDYEVTYTRNAVTGPYRVININDKKQILVNSILDVARHIGRGKSEIQYDLCRKFKFIYGDGWVVVPANEPFNIEDYKPKPKQHSNIKVTRQSDGKEFILPSMIAAAKMFGLDKKTVFRNVNTDKYVKGYMFRAID